MPTKPASPPIFSFATQRCRKILEPTLNAFVLQLTEPEKELIGRISEEDAAAMFSIWQSEQITHFSALWKEEFMKRHVVEADLREAKDELKHAVDDLRVLRALLEGRIGKEKENEAEVRYLKRALEASKLEAAEAAAEKANGGRLQPPAVGRPKSALGFRLGRNSG
ncbi:hypothetical protein L873DRAFT_1814246 [Choiromyces venosus 120613-1]|uniref:Uncharacterized protein n=1 Tax=Choiromyces venosus 120613-1 TaxID=1336337 RepID=A0A3N4J843_9PEZI|nr:hypothetical protein L873DRAFT_1814246 [Choiromyces venosus 120613-1]